MSETVSAESRELTKECGFVSVEIPAHPKAQELCDAIIASDLAFVVAGKVDMEKVSEFWQQNCAGLPNIPERSPKFFPQLLAGKFVTSIDNDLVTSGTPYRPAFGTPSSFLMMDFPEFDSGNTDQESRAITGETKKIMQELFGREAVDWFTRDEINTALWSDHDQRIPSAKATAFKRKLISSNENPDEYELRLMEYSEYVRLANKYEFGKHGFSTHMDGYLRLDEDRHLFLKKSSAELAESAKNNNLDWTKKFTLPAGTRNSMISGDVVYGGAAKISACWRGSSFVKDGGGCAVRLVLSRKLTKSHI